MLAEAGSHRTGIHGMTPLVERDRSRHAGAGNGDDDDEDRVTDQHGRILRDNVYGNIDDDVWRRDFTANSLYYNIADFSIWDYTGGVDDIAARRLKLIGDPVTRYREDPVRMLRAARFEAKLGFSLDGETGTAIASLRELLGSVPPARLFDETLKLFLTGHGARSMQVLRERGLLAELLPSVAGYLESPSRWRGGASRAAGPAEHRSTRGAGQAGDADFPVRAAAVRADRRDHREAAAGEVARHRHHCRRRGPRGACRAGSHLDPEAFLAGRARDVRGPAAARAAARPPCPAHAGAAALPRRLRPAAAARRHGTGCRARSPTGGRACRKSPRPIAIAWPMRWAAQPRPAGEGGAGGGGRRRPRRRRRGRGRAPAAS